MLTARQLAAYLGCSEGTVQRLVRRGALSATRIGRRLRFRPEDVTAYLSGAAERDSAALRELKRAHERTACLQEVTAALAAALTPADVARVIIARGAGALGAYAGALVLRRDDAPLLDVITSEGYAPGSWEQTATLPLDAPLPIADAARTGEPVWLPDAAAYTQRYPHLAAAPQRSAAVAALPLRGSKGLLGALGLSFAVAQPFGADDRRYAVTLVNLCAQALERARLFQQAELAALRAAEAGGLLDTFVAASPVGVAFLDTELRYLLINPALASLNGPPVADHLGRTIGEILPASGELIAAYCRAVLATGQPILDAELSGELPSRPGVTRTWLESFYPVHAIDGTLRGVGVVVTEITERKQAEAERELLLAREQAARAAAEAAIQLREDFLSVAAHELKTPLTALLGQAQLLERRLGRAGLLAGPHAASARTVIAQAGRLNAMILALLDVNRLAQGALALELGPLDAAALVRQVAQEAEPTLAAHRLAVELPPTALPVLGDPLRLEQVLQNLLSNAVKYSPSGGTIRLSARAEGGEAQITVADEGIGIPEEALAQLGTRFYRAPNVATRSYSGLGIGLHIVREIVALHGGRLTVQSEEGAGTAVTVHLPLH